MVDVYHHLDPPEVFVADIARALKPGGHLYIVDFDPSLEGSSDWVEGHVHLDATEVRNQVVDTGRFVAIDPDGPPLTANRMMSFRRQ